MGSASGVDSVCGSGEAASGVDEETTWATGLLEKTMGPSSGADISDWTVVSSSFASGTVAVVVEISTGMLGVISTDDSKAGVLEIGDSDAVTEMLPSSAVTEKDGARPGFRIFPTTSRSSGVPPSTWIVDVDVGVTSVAVASVGNTTDGSVWPGNTTDDWGRLADGVGRLLDSAEASLALKGIVEGPLMTLVATMVLSPSMDAMVCCGGGTWKTGR